MPREQPAPDAVRVRVERAMNDLCIHEKSAWECEQSCLLANVIGLLRTIRREALEEAAKIADDAWNRAGETCNMKWHAEAIAKALRREAEKETP